MSLHSEYNKRGGVAQHASKRPQTICPQTHPSSLRQICSIMHHVTSAYTDRCADIPVRVKPPLTSQLTRQTCRHVHIMTSVLTHMYSQSRFADWRCLTETTLQSGVCEQSGGWDHGLDNGCRALHIGPHMHGNHLKVVIHMRTHMFRQGCHRQARGTTHRTTYASIIFLMSWPAPGPWTRG